MAKRWPVPAGFPGQRVDPFPSGFLSRVQREDRLKRPRNSIESKLEHERDKRRNEGPIFHAVPFDKYEAAIALARKLLIKKPKERPFLTSLTHPHVVAWLAARGGRAASPEWTDEQRKVYETTRKRWQAHHWGHRGEKYAKLEGFNNRSARRRSK